MIDPYKTNLITNLKKTQGQINHILKMVEDEKYCTDIVSQVNAALGLLKKAKNHILESHLMTCGAKNLTSNDLSKKEDFVKELVRTFSLTNK
jgi:DNA-binding FrmR family transcriptional regulator